MTLINVHKNALNTTVNSGLSCINKMNARAVQYCICAKPSRKWVYTPVKNKGKQAGCREVREPVRASNILHCIFFIF